jgi:deoxyribonuclease V
MPTIALVGVGCHHGGVMHVRKFHRWNVSPRAAMAVQLRLRERVRCALAEPLPANPLVAGADISYDRGSDVMYAAVVVVRLPDLAVMEQQDAVAKARFPYVPGLLGFREAPALLRCFRRLKHVPDAVLVDGHGQAHPRRFGVASHLGVILDVPTVGCAKSILCGETGRLGERRGSVSPLVDRGEPVGCALWTRDGVKPVYVSVGHKIDLGTAVDLVVRCGGRYRLPEPTRLAHLAVNELRCRAK